VQEVDRDPTELLLKRHVGANLSLPFSKCKAQPSFVVNLVSSMSNFRYNF
jgi:hypothetical protein